MLGVIDQYGGKCFEYLNRLKIKHAVPPLLLGLFILKLLLKEPMHGYQLTIKLNELLKIDIPRQMVYFILKKQEEAGFVKSEWMLEDEAKPRRVYSITDDGKKFLKDIIPYLKALIEKVEHL